MATGVLAAAAGVFLLLPSAPEAVIIGCGLLGFAAGWAVLAWATARFTTWPQRWAYVLSIAMATTGALLVATDPGEPVLTQLAWFWAPATVAVGLWAWRQTRRHLGGRRALLVYPALTVMLLAGVGGLSQATTPDPRVAAGPMPGRLVDVGGYRLHLDCSGTGSPTVILLNGLGESSPMWARVAPGVASSARVCTYDRAGQGWSDNSPNPDDGDNAADDLHRLLTAAGEHGPYVLVGHSSGGAHALIYAHRHPADVSGIVLLDSVSPHQVAIVSTFKNEYQVMRRVLAVAPTGFRLGVGRIIMLGGTPDLPAGAARQAAVFANSPRGWQGMRAEQAALPLTFSQAQATRLGDTPLVVLTASANVDSKPGWGTAQDELAALSTNSRHTVAPFEHSGFLMDPAGAAQSVAAIDDVLTAARDHTHVPAR